MKRKLLIAHIILGILLMGGVAFDVTAQEVKNASKVTDININIPVGNCEKINEGGKKLVECSGNFVTGIYDITGLLLVVFQFVIMSGIVIVSFMAILEGARVLFYSPMASKVSAAKDRLIKYSTTLIVLIFSVVIFNQIDPRLSNPTNVIKPIVNIALCTEIDDSTICDQNNACTWIGSTCINKASQSCESITTDIPCVEMGCTWVPEANRCTKSPIMNKNTCQRGDSPNECGALPSCLWSIGCTPKTKPTDLEDPLYATCSAFTTFDQCTGNTSCAWKEACQNGSTVLKLPCNSARSQYECPTLHCWKKYNPVGNQYQSCEITKAIGAECTFNEMCGDTAYCSSDDICEAQLPNGAKCGGKANDKYTDDNSACASYYCDESLDGIDDTCKNKP